MSGLDGEGQGAEAMVLEDKLTKVVVRLDMNPVLGRVHIQPHSWTPEVKMA